MRDRLREVWSTATDAEKAEGRAWYPTALRAARAISAESGLPLRRVVGLIAVYSPRCRWKSNLTRARKAACGSPPATFGFVIRKAQAILAGASPLRVLKGPKERAFYKAILGDLSAVTVDVHCWKAAGGEGDRVRNYPHVAAEYSAVAAEVGETPRDFQAIIWVRWRAGI